MNRILLYNNNNINNTTEIELERGCNANKCLNIKNRISAIQLSFYACLNWGVYVVI